MKVLVLNGSPHPNGATTDMVSAFEKGAKEAGHEVIIFAVARMNVKGCLGCEYCHNKGEGKCVQQDDMQTLYPEFLSADRVRSSRTSVRSMVSIEERSEVYLL